MKTHSDDLNILLTVIDTGSFTAAADVLDTQVSTVSRAVGRVEKALGVTILNRTTRRVSLSEEGRSFVTQVRASLAMLAQAEDDVMSKGEVPAGRLRVDAASPFMLHQIVPLVVEFSQCFPQIDLELSSNEGYVDLLEHRTDVAIRIGALTDSTLHARPLGKSRLFVVAAPSYIETHGKPNQPMDLHQHKLIGFTGAKVLNDWPLPEIGKLNHAIHCSSGETVRQLVLAGNGIACLSGFMVNKDMVEGRLQSLLDSKGYMHPTRGSIHGVYYKSSAVSKRISAFLDFIQPRLNL